MSRLRVGVLVSGRGSNLQALIDAGKDPMYPARVVMVCANRDCAALELAKKAGISREIFRLASFPDRKARDLAMAKTLRMHDVELVVCAGYDAILERAFTRQFEGRIINIHPSLLPEFAGTMDAVAMALQAGVTETGCTVHVVTDDVDQGPILAQRRVEVRADDTVEGLRERIQAEEHTLLAVVVKRLAGQPLPLAL
jgi:phosphoribosylglycinamide formyltransferase-1